LIKLKTLRLINYCGYKDMSFDFTNGSNGFKGLSMFFGPNGAGKTNLLRVVELLATAQRYENRPTDLVFRKLTHHPDYDPDVENYKAEFKKQKAAGKVMNANEKDADWLEVDPMRVEGLFATDEGEKTVTITTDQVEKNELPKVYGKAYKGHAYYIDADHPMNMHKFQFPSSKKDVFLELAHTIYGFDCELLKGFNAMGENGKDSIGFFTDFVIQKGDKRIHFKRMSDGERKIATLIRALCDPDYKMLDMILIDNVEMHIYMERHIGMINKILELFPEKQFFMTTHSPILVGCRSAGIEPYLGQECLYDLNQELELVT
jgi:hypothetical protein